MYSEILNFRTGPSSYTWQINPEIARQEQLDADKHNAAIQKRWADEAKRLNNGALRKSPTFRELQEVDKEYDTIQSKLTEQKALVSQTVKRIQEVKYAELQETYHPSRDIDQFINTQMEIEQLTKQLITQKGDLREYEQQLATAADIRTQTRRKLKEEYIRLITPHIKQVEEGLSVANEAQEQIRFLSEQAQGLDFAAPTEPAEFGLRFKGTKEYYDEWASR